jgi:hypothetical protein
MPKATARVDHVRQLQSQLENSVTELVTSGDWRAMLDTAAKFPAYSWGNVMLIYRQMPMATRVAGFKTWQSLGRHVLREHAIRILAPCRYKVEDPETGESRMVVRGFTTACVFDVSQTAGAELPNDIRPELLAGEAPAGLWDALVGRLAADGFTVIRGDCGGANGHTNFLTKVVSVRDDVDEAQAVKTLAHELAHVVLRHADAYAQGHRGRAEIEAESTSYVICSAFGMATDGYSIPYVATWSSGDVAKVRETAVRVVEAAAGILTALTAAQRPLEAV